MSKTIWTPTRRRFITSSSSMALAGLAAPGLAQTRFPNRPVTLIVPWTAGGSTDMGFRALAEAAQKHLGERIIVENKPGAAGTLGPAQMAAGARPDGYTLAQMPITMFRLPHMTRVAFNPLTDFSYVVHVAGYCFGTTVRADSPHKTMKDLIDFARGNPDKVTYATPGAGTSLHITMMDIAARESIKWTHVPFRGASETNAAVLGGHVVAQADSSGWAPLVNAGQLRLLATWGKKRTKSWPTVPTLQESGIDIVSNSPFGIAGPKGMDPGIVKVLQDAFKKGIEEPDHLRVMDQLDQEVDYMDTATYEAFVKTMYEDMRQQVERLNLRRS
jgi:tripartite-type tricarboxylate transporter receptor subunit TctC